MDRAHDWLSIGVLESPRRLTRNRLNCSRDRFWEGFGIWMARKQRKDLALTAEHIKRFG